MDKQKEKALYRQFSTVMTLAGGMIGGWVFVLLFVGLWLAETLFSSMDWTVGIDDIVRFLLFFGVLGWLFGLPAAWLTARSVCKRRLRRNWKGCLKTAAWGAWWSAATMGGLLLLFVSCTVIHIGQDELFFFGVMYWAMFLAIPILVLCGLVSAALLSFFLPKPETNSQTAFRQPEQET